ncbi:MAG: hypothetical protein JXR51_06315 [Bacteroidales bacterium]|nr:hypothetical protein [Bacteroidales bacterium]MBN2756775.1 hypothetical protein [Bacteroidales bacterium]
MRKIKILTFILISMILINSCEKKIIGDIVDTAAMICFLDEDGNDLLDTIRYDKSINADYIRMSYPTLLMDKK